MSEVRNQQAPVAAPLADGEEPTADNWIKVGTGEYTSWLFGFSIGEYSIYCAPDEPKICEIRDLFAISGNNFRFVWDRSTNELFHCGGTFDCNYDDPNYGAIWADDGDGVPTYDTATQTITFPMCYTIPEANLSFVYDGDDITTGPDYFVFSELNLEAGIAPIVDNSATAPSAVYTLDGRRVQTMTAKGVYIVDGQNRIVK